MEQEIDLLLNKNTKIVIRPYPGRSAVMEIRRAVNSHTLGHGWLTESQLFLEPTHIVAIHESLGLLLPSEGTP
jgi:hypothetical protein